MVNAIEVSNLCKEYTDFKLDHVSFNVTQGSIMGFIGENGAGKSTTIKSMLNLVKKDSGSVKLMGLDGVEDQMAIRKQIGVVFDETYFQVNLNASQIQMIFSKLYDNWSNELYKQYLKQFELPIDKKIKDYSKGMKAKLNIAVALSHSPKLLILDEATSGLDPVVRDEVLEVFYDYVRKKENTILMSTHITTDLDKIADDITFIHKGNIIFSKSKEELLSNTAIMKCNEEAFSELDKSYVSRYRKEPGYIEVLIDRKAEFVQKYNAYSLENASIEGVMLLNIKGQKDA